MLGLVPSPFRAPAGLDRRSLVTAGVGAALTVLSLVSLGLPATLLLLGAWTLGLGIGRFDPRLAGPSAWAGGVVAEVALLSALDFLKALVSGREHGRLVNLGVLVIPVLLGLVLAALFRSRQDDEQTPSRLALPATVTAVGLVLPMWVAAHGKGFDVAWALSGDGRNHIAIMRGLLSRDGVTLTELKSYPALVNTISGLVSGAGGRRGLAPGALMVHDARAVTATYVVSGIGIASMFVAALLECLPRAVRLARRLPLGIVLLTLCSAATSVSSLVLGTSLLDGFFATYGTIPVTLAAIVLALRCVTRPSPVSYGLIGTATVFAIFGWTVLAIVPVAATLAVTGPVLRMPRSVTWLVGVAVGAGSVLLTLGVLVTQYSTLRKQFLTPGPLPTPLQHWMLYLLTLVCVAVLASAGDRVATRQRAMLVGIAVLGLFTVWWLRHITPDHQTWTYYGAKSLWAISSCLLWVLFLPVALAAAAEPASAQRWRTWGLQPLRYGAAGLALVIVVGLLTNVADPLHKASHGWTQPSAAVIHETAVLGDQGRPFVFWHWSDPGDDRLGDFAAVLTWASTPNGQPTSLPGYPQGFQQWGYMDSFLFPQLCMLARAVPGLRVITQDPLLHDHMRDSCPASGAHVEVVPKPAGAQAS